MPKTVVSIRETIMTTIEGRLVLTKPSYTYDVPASRVNRRNIELPEQPNLPCIFVYEGDESKDESRTPNSLLCTLPVAVVYMAEEGDPDEQLTTANSMLEDISRAMGSDFLVADKNGKNQQVDMEELSNEVITAEVNGSLVYTATTFSVQYYHKRGDQSVVQ